MKVLPCPDCGQKIRPCNHARHRRAQHLPKIREAFTRWDTPTKPINVGKRKDRRYDEHVPRGEGDHRFRIYRLRAGELELVMSAPDAEAMGKALATAHAEGEFDQADDACGILDTIEDPGHWLSNPWALGRRRDEG